MSKKNIVKGFLNLLELLNAVGHKIKVNRHLKYLVKKLDAIVNHANRVMVTAYFVTTLGSNGEKLKEFLGLKVGDIIDDRSMKEKIISTKLPSPIIVCSIDVFNKQSNANAPQLKAASKGMNHAYDKSVSDKIIMYRNRNPSNKKINIGNLYVLVTSYIEEKEYQPLPYHHQLTTRAIAQ